MSTFIGRRQFIAGAATFSMASRALASTGTRAISFDNLHTGERLNVQYWTDGSYVPQALAEVNHVLRDFRSGEVHPIAPQLLDLLTAIHGQLETPEPFSVISGYRSPATNALLRSAHEDSGVATKSLHMSGMAIDIRVPGRSLTSLHDTALALRSGGVGYYPQSDFVHVDVGRVRRW